MTTTQESVEAFRQLAKGHDGQIIFTCYPAFGRPHDSVVPPWELDAYLMMQPGEDATLEVDPLGAELRWHRKPGGSFTDGGSSNRLWLRPKQ